MHGNLLVAVETMMGRGMLRAWSGASSSLQGYQQECLSSLARGPA